MANVCSKSISTLDPPPPPPPPHLTLDQNKHNKFLPTLEARTKCRWGHYYEIPVFHGHSV